MPWYKTEDEFDDKEDTHVRAEAIGLFICMGTFCSRNLTDGLIAKARVKGLPGYSPARVKLLLKDRGTEEGKPWIIEEGDSYRIRNFLKFNPSKEQVLAEREKNAKRIDHWRSQQKTKGVTPSVTPHETEGVTPDVTPLQTSLPTPLETPLVTGASRIPYPVRTEREGIQGVGTDSARGPDFGQSAVLDTPPPVPPPVPRFASLSLPEEDPDAVKRKLREQAEMSRRAAV
jgi:hypothetical protein